MSSLMRKFISLNVNLTNFVDQKFPSIHTSESWDDLLLSIITNILNERAVQSVLEVGGIDRPLLKRSSGFRYDVMDIEYRGKCEKLYDNFYVQSIEQPIENKYDLIVSKTLLEHVRDNDASVTQMYKALFNGGYVVHYMPSKYHPYSLSLRAVGPKYQKKLIKMLRPWAADRTGYPAFFDKCSPKEMRELFKSKGFKYVETIPFFKANHYFQFFFPFYIAAILWNNICQRLKCQQLCSGFIIIAQK